MKKIGPQTLSGRCAVKAVVILGYQAAGRLPG
jgi:hypothetical protein